VSGSVASSCDATAHADRDPLYSVGSVETPALYGRMLNRGDREMNKVRGRGEQQGFRK